MRTELVHASTAVGVLSGGDLALIFQMRRERNVAAEVTSALLYHDGNGMQVLEGPPASSPTRATPA
jgi:hypothetical protein